MVEVSLQPPSPEEAFCWSDYMVGKWELSKHEFICLQYKGRCVSACLVRPPAHLRAVGKVWRSHLNIYTNTALPRQLLIIRLQQHKQALPGEKCPEPEEGVYSTSSNKGRYAEFPSWIACFAPQQLEDKHHHLCSQQQVFWDCNCTGRPQKRQCAKAQSTKSRTLKTNMLKQQFSHCTKTALWESHTKSFSQSWTFPVIKFLSPPYPDFLQKAKIPYTTGYLSPRNEKTHKNPNRLIAWAWRCHLPFFWRLKLHCHSGMNIDVPLPPRRKQHSKSLRISGSSQLTPILPRDKAVTRAGMLALTPLPLY